MIDTMTLDLVDVMIGQGQDLLEDEAAVVVIERTFTMTGVMIEMRTDGTMIVMINTLILPLWYYYSSLLC